MRDAFLHRALWPTVVAAIALSLLPACHARGRPAPPVTGPPRMVGTGSCDLDLSGNKAETVFFVLGFLGEYLGRIVVEDGDYVERLYCDETDKVPLFRRVLRSLALEQGLDPAVQEETEECVRFYYSRPIAARLNSCYTYAFTGSEAVPDRLGRYKPLARPHLLFSSGLFRRSPDGRPGVLAPAGLPGEIFFRQRALAYVAGAWTRYRHGNEIWLHNSLEKAVLIAGLLERLGCLGISVESIDGLPQANIIRFMPTAEVRAWFNRSW